MDLRQIEYIVVIEQEQDISKATEKLYLTQSVLDQQLLHLEKELGTPLSERREHSIIPTLTGRIYLATACHTVDIKRETYKIISDTTEENASEMLIAYAPEQGSLMFSCIYPHFREKYPNITFSVREARIKKMEQMILQKEVTMVNPAYFRNQKNPFLEYIDMGEELTVLGLSVSHPLAHLTDDNSFRTFPEIDLRLLRGDSFALVSRETRMRDTINRAFEETGSRPGILLESANTRTVVNMMRQQICLAFSSQSYTESEAPVAYFSVRPQQTWMRCMAYLKRCYLTKPEKYYIKLMTWYVQGCLQGGPRLQGAAQTGISKQPQTECHSFSG